MKALHILAVLMVVALLVGLAPRAVRLWSSMLTAALDETAMEGTP